MGLLKREAVKHVDERHAKELRGIKKRLAEDLQGVKKEADWLREERRKMRLFLKIAEEQQYEHDTLPLLLSDVRELALEIKRMLGDFYLEYMLGDFYLEHMLGDFYLEFGREASKLQNMEETVKSFKEKIESFKGRIQNLNNSCQRFQLLHSGGSRRTEDLRAVPNFRYEEDFVGFEDEAKKLLDELFDAKETRRSIISIYAMGGSGKTTLATKLHNNDRVKEEFKIRVWVTVSKVYTIRDLLLRIVKSFEMDSTVKVSKLEDPDKKEVKELMSYIQQSLRGHRYLVVIDDVWDQKVWPILEEVLPNNKKGSRVIITTRDKEVADNSDVRITHVHPLRKLKPNESWQLFYKEVSRNSNKHEQLQLLEKLGGQPLKNLGKAMLGRHDEGQLPKKVGEMMVELLHDLTPDQETCKQMVDKCDGLPLAIAVLGGLLCTKQLHEWSTVRNNMLEKLKKRSPHMSSKL